MDDNTVIVLGEFGEQVLFGGFDESAQGGQFDEPAFIGAAFQKPEAVGEGDVVVGEDDEVLGG